MDSTFKPRVLFALITLTIWGNLTVEKHLKQLSARYYELKMFHDHNIKNTIPIAEPTTTPYPSPLLITSFRHGTIKW